jgi:formate-dependent nitrite reductase membrane component NrfD
MVAFVAMVICPILLTLDLGRPSRFWHMLVDARTWGLSLKYWSPMSVGAWALFFFGLFATLSFIDALAGNGWLRHPSARRFSNLMTGALGVVVMVLGSFFGLFVAGYTGVLLSVSNQPVWSDTWALGGLFLASGLSTGAAALAIVTGRRAEEITTEGKLARVDRVFTVLELILLVIFFATLGTLAARLFAPRWLVLWLLVALGIIVPLALSRQARPPVLAAWLGLIGAFALRMVVVFGAQA